MSGAAALILENLWFRQAARFVGNSVWATSIVLASFMAGIALGSGLAARLGSRTTRLIRVYGMLELAIAATGAVMIAILPQLTGALAPAFRELVAWPVALNVVRLVLAFLLVLVPTVAMGATLPLLVAALGRRERNFGRVLGRLYGWNTLGAVAGILAVELVLVSELGMRGAAGIAMVLNVSAGASAMWLSRAIGEGARTGAPEARMLLTWTARRILAAGFLCGAILLALEVVWFRFLALYVLSTSIALSLMLAVILAGIGLGGLIAGRWLAGRSGQLLAVLAAIASVFAYAAFPADGAPGSQRWQDAVIAAVRLALPVSLLSGALFTVLGDAAKRAIGSDTRAAGLFVVCNTVGAMVGALVGGFVLLPVVGMEGSLFVLSAAYGVVALCVPWPRPRIVAILGGAAIAGALALFPFGRMMSAHIPQVLSPVGGDATLVAYREAVTGTLSVVGFRWADQPLAYQLFTNGFSMSSTLTGAQRYMKLFVYWPIALRPNIKDALLICYGVGQTAKALTDTAALEHIDVVDISRDILELGRLEYPQLGAFPLDDPRVAVHVEDGRFFLRTTTTRYDLITGEPPPPQVAGVVDLYTREYFQLVRDHLSDGGVTSYWLPVHELSVDDARVITRAFCAVFDDCSLWAGSGFDWMLIGTRGFRGRATETQFVQQWQDPHVGPELAALGFEHPEQLGATFMADGAALRAWLADAPVLDDDHPDRLGHHLDPPAGERFATFAAWMDASGARERFATSELITRLWPAELRARSLPYFRAQQAIDAIALEPYFSPMPMAVRMRLLDQLHGDADVRAPVLWLFGLTQHHLDILDRAGDVPALAFARAIRALADRKYATAAELFAAAREHEPWSDADVQLLRSYALQMAGR